MFYIICKGSYCWWSCPVKVKPDTGCLKECYILPFALGVMRVESVVSNQTAEELAQLRASPTTAPRSSPTGHELDLDQSGSGDTLNHSDALKR